MINQIINPFEQIITNLPYIEKYGGLAIPMRRIDVNEFGLKETTIFPVSCGIDEMECWEQGKYGHLTPDDSTKSIFYFESISDLKPISSNNNNRDIALEGIIRLVGWLNLLKLGHSDQCSISAAVSLELISKLVGQYNLNFAPFETGKLKVELQGQPSKTPAIFDRYSYENDVLQLLMHPYDYLALDFKVSVTINRKCIQSFIPNSPVDCHNPL